MGSTADVHWGSVVKASDLVPVAFMYRALAASKFNGDKEEYERLEGISDMLYDQADGFGIEFERVPRLASEILRTDCDECGKEFLPQRRSAKFCSNACNMKAKRRRRADRPYKGGNAPDQEVGI